MSNDGAEWADGAKLDAFALSFSCCLRFVLKYEKFSSSKLEERSLALKAIETPNSLGRSML